jgi:hypothetical protein
MGKEGTIISDPFVAHVAPIWAKWYGDHMGQLVWVLVIWGPDGRFPDIPVRPDGCHLGVNGAKTIWSPHGWSGAHLPQMHGPHVICPDGDQNLTLMAQLPPIWDPYVLLAGHASSYHCIVYLTVHTPAVESWGKTCISEPVHTLHRFSLQKL